MTVAPAKKQPGLRSVVILTACAVAAVVVAKHEGRRYTPYLDPVKILTVCDGITSGVIKDKKYTDAECDALLTKELVEHGVGIDTCIKVEIPVKTRAAFTSFAYNVGVANFCGSTLLKKVNQGDTLSACNELTRWVYAKGKVLPGLVERRKQERKLCIEGVTDGAIEVAGSEENAR